MGPLVWALIQTDWCHKKKRLGHTQVVQGWALKENRP